MLNVDMHSVIMLSIVMQNVAMLGALVPLKAHKTLIFAPWCIVHGEGPRQVHKLQKMHLKIEEHILDANAGKQ